MPSWDCAPPPCRAPVLPAAHTQPPQPPPPAPPPPPRPAPCVPCPAPAGRPRRAALPRCRARCGPARPGGSLRPPGDRAGAAQPQARHSWVNWIIFCFCYLKKSFTPGVVLNLAFCQKALTLRVIRRIDREKPIKNGKNTRKDAKKSLNKGRKPEAEKGSPDPARRAPPRAPARRRLRSTKAWDEGIAGPDPPPWADRAGRRGRQGLGAGELASTRLDPLPTAIDLAGGGACRGARKYEVRSTLPQDGQAFARRPYWRGGGMARHGRRGGRAAAGHSARAHGPQDLGRDRGRKAGQGEL